MAGQISINTVEAKSIYDKSVALTEEIRTLLADLDREVTDLPDRGEWKGDAASKFMGTYADMQNKITVEFPDLLLELSNNLTKNLENLVNADAAGA